MVFSAGYFFSYLLRTINAALAPDLIRDFSLDAGGLGLLTGVYFVGFGLFQLPLGLLLDRFGARRVEAVLLLIAALGALRFATADGFGDLVLGRALIGLGVSACLMAGFKALTLWFPSQRLPLVNGMLLGLGACGAVFAGPPVQFALQYVDWRGIFFGLVGMAVALAMMLMALVPEPKSVVAPESPSALIRGLRQILSDYRFWRLAPLTMTSQGTYLAVQGLWAGVWLQDVAGLTRVSVADYMAILSVAMAISYAGSGFLAERLSRKGVSPQTTAVVGMVCFIVIQILIISLGAALPSGAPLLSVWFLFGLTGGFSVVCYAALTQSFPAPLAGRVNTAINMTLIACAFLFQYGIGVVVGWWPTQTPGHFAVSGHRVALALTVGFQIVALIWFWLAPFLRQGRLRQGSFR
ncbi:Major facilitator superfamily membrane protein [Azospirillaceae bacterium]